MHRRYFTWSAAVIALGVGACLPMGLASAPLDEPPLNALRRYDPKRYDVGFQVLLKQVAPIADPSRMGNFQFEEAPIVMPIIYMGSYSRVFPNSEKFTLMLDNAVVRDPATRRDDKRPYNTHIGVLVAPKFNGQTLRWTLEYSMQSWSSAIDERLAQQSTWPRNLEWPADVRDGLQKQKYIESDHERFTQILRDNNGANLRNVSPYIAAKQIVLFVLNNFQVSGTGVTRGGLGEIRGMNVQGALAAVMNSDARNRAVGSEHDLVCLCVAMLRAAGIPARPVIGLAEPEASLGGRSGTTLVSWAEFYLPNSGWAPFDPAAMIGGLGSYQRIDAPWKHFGTLDELNERVPLGYHFLPPADGMTVPEYPAVWGWEPRPPQQPYYEQAISLSMTGRGKGEEDPR